MSNTPNDFDFDDDIFGNGNGNGHDETPDDFLFDDAPSSQPFGFSKEPADEFDFGDGPDLSGEDLPDTMPVVGVIPTAEGDMPVIEVEPEPGGGASRTFILIAVGLIFIFAIGLIFLLLLTTRPTGPTEIDQTSTQVALLNQTVEAQLVATQTQNADFIAQTQTAEAATDTPTPTDIPTDTPAPPTDIPTATIDPTQVAGTAQALAFAQTATALAQPSNTPAPPTVPPTATFTPEPGVPTALPTDDFGLLFSTQVAFATQAADVDNAILATLQALSTVAAANPQQPIVVDPNDPNVQATAAAIVGQSGLAATAGAIIDTALDAFALTAAPLQTQLAALTPAAQATSAALSTQIAGFQATQSAVQQQVGSLIATAFAQQDTPAPIATLDALATQLADLGAQDPVAAQATQVAAISATQAAGSGQVAALQAQIDQLQQVIDGLTQQLTEATAQPPSDDQATLVAGFIATQTAGQTQLLALQQEVVRLQAELALLNNELAQATSLPPSDFQATRIAGLEATQGALSLEVAMLQATIQAGGPAGQATLEAAGTQIAAANQQLFLVQAQQATQQAQATQAALATREMLVQELISGTVVAIVPTSPLDAVNQTATALANAFGTPVAPAATLEGTPGFPTAVPTPGALPDTGLFDEVGGDSFGVLAVAIVGLIGVIVVARALRRKNADGGDEGGEE